MNLIRLFYKFADIYSLDVSFRSNSNPKFEYLNIVMVNNGFRFPAKIKFQPFSFISTINTFFF